MKDAVEQVAALETDVALSAASAEAAADAASRAVVAAEVIEAQVEHAEQAAAAAIVEEVHANTRETEWNTERLDRMETTLSETRALVAPLMATLETLTASVALLVNNSPSVASPPLAPETPSPSSGSGDGLPEVVTPEAAAPEVPQSPPKKEKRFRLMR